VPVSLVVGQDDDDVGPGDLPCTAGLLGGQRRRDGGQQVRQCDRPESTGFASRHRAPCSLKEYPPSSSLRTVQLHPGTAHAERVAPGEDQVQLPAVRAHPLSRKIAVLAGTHVPFLRKEGGGPGPPGLRCIVDPEATLEARVSTILRTWGCGNLLPPEVAAKAGSVGHRRAQGAVRVHEDGAPSLD